MKAAVIEKFGPPDVFRIKETDIPKPKANQVLIKVIASSINPIDWKQRKGVHRYILGSPFPIILGYDVAGEIVEKGNKVVNFNVGDKVNTRLDNKYGGALAEYALASEKCLAGIPDNPDYEKYAALPLAAVTALQALRDKANVKSGDEVLIIGAAGGLGYYAVQIATIYNARVTAVSSKRHEELIHKLAPEVFVDYTKENILHTNKKFDIIFDVVGIYSFLQCKQMLKPKGRYVTSLPRLKLIVHKLLSIFTGKKVTTLMMRSVGKDISLVNKWYLENKLFVHIDKTFPLEKIADAHKYMEEGHTEGKIVIRIQ